MISAALMVIALSSAQSVGMLYDEINHKQQRVAATASALTCLNLAFVELEHDYFYHVDKPGINYASLHCSILSVTSTNSNDINAPGADRSISVSGTSIIAAVIDAQVLINSQNISVLSSTVIF
jgi:predicted solute-binding protein